MKRIVLIACGKRKRPYRSRAEDLYIGTLFKLSLRYARSLRPDMVFILSAKHGLLDLGRKIEPYESTLNNMPTTEIRAWSAGTSGAPLSGIPGRFFLRPVAAQGAGGAHNVLGHR